MNKIQQRRVKLGLSQVELARKLKVSQGTVSKLEREQVRLCDLILRLEKVLGGKASDYVRRKGKV